MPTIDQLSSTSVLYDTDKLPLFSPTQDDTRAATLPQLAAYVQAKIEGIPDETEYNIGSGDGFAVTVLPVTIGGSVHARIALTAAVATGTIILPGIDDRVQGQEVLVTCTKQVSALTINGNGATLSGAPTSIGPTTPFKLRFDSISTTWDKVSS